MIDTRVAGDHVEAGRPQREPLKRQAGRQAGRRWWPAKSLPPGDWHPPPPNRRHGPWRLAPTAGRAKEGDRESLTRRLTSKRDRCREGPSTEGQCLLMTVAARPHLSIARPALLRG